MISVLIPATEETRADGIAHYILDVDSGESVFDDHEILQGKPVQVVPAGALQALLKQSRSFTAYERRFGKVANSERARLLALFSLIEEERTWDPAKRQDYMDWTVAKRR